MPPVTLLWAMALFRLAILSGMRLFRPLLMLPEMLLPSILLFSAEMTRKSPRMSLPVTTLFSASLSWNSSGKLPSRPRRESP